MTEYCFVCKSAIDTEGNCGGCNHTPSLCRCKGFKDDMLIGNPVTTSCIYCGAFFSREDELDLHVQQKHQNVRKE